MKNLLVLFAILAMGLYGMACDDNGGGGGGVDTVEPPVDTVEPPEDTLEPPEDTLEPPEDTLEPPEDTLGEVVPPVDTVEPPVGACLNDADMAILGPDGGAAAKAAATDCAMACIAEPTVEEIVACANPCVVADTGLTEDCSGCYTAIIACTIINCLGECVADSAAPECLGCMDASGCYADFFECTGLEPPVEPQVDMCLGDADLAILDPDGGAAVKAAATNCAMGCIAEPTVEEIVVCANPCVITDTGLTEGCSACYTGIIACTIINCLADCVADSEAPECLACMDASGCYAAFYTCSGQTP